MISIKLLQMEAQQLCLLGKIFLITWSLLFHKLIADRRKDVFQYRSWDFKMEMFRIKGHFPRQMGKKNTTWNLRE